MKRAVLSLARERSEILFGLEGGKVKALTLAGSPSDDRKVGSRGRQTCMQTMQTCVVHCTCNQVGGVG